MTRLAILGASGHGRVVADCAGLCGWKEVVFFDDAWPELSSSSRWEVEGDFAALLKRLGEFSGVIVAIGDNACRLKKLSVLENAGAPIISLVHPGAIVSPFASVGRGTVVFAGAVINVDARVGDGVIINTGACIDHDCVLDDGVHVSPGAHLGGGVEVGERSWAGIGSCVRQYLKIGPDVMVGAGAAVVTDVKAGLTVVGVPARPVQENGSE